MVADATAQRPQGLTVWPSQCIQHCARHAACPGEEGGQGLPAAWLLASLGGPWQVSRQVSAFLCPWVWNHQLLLFGWSPMRLALPVAEALGPMW